MENLRIGLSLVNDALFPFEIENGKELITALYGDDTGAPPRSLTIEASSDDGQTVRINVGYDESPRAHVTVEIAEDWMICSDCDNGTIYVVSVPDGKRSTKRCSTCGGLGRVKRSGRP